MVEVLVPGCAGEFVCGISPAVTEDDTYLDVWCTRARARLEIMTAVASATHEEKVVVRRGRGGARRDFVSIEMSNVAVPGVEAIAAIFFLTAKRCTLR